MQEKERGIFHSHTDWAPFEKLLLSLSSQFISLPFEQIDGAIEETQRQMCEALGFDLSTLWQWSDKDRNIMMLTHLYSPPDGPQRPEEIDAAKSFPWVLQKMQSGETIAYSTDQLTEQAALDQESRNFYGVKSSVNIPLMAGTALTGILTFDTIWENRIFQIEEINRLKIVAEIVNNTLARKLTEERLMESETRFTLATESAGAGIWELDVSTGLFWTTNKALAIFGYDSGEIVKMERFERSVHPDDREYIQRALFCSLHHGEPLSVEYRILTDDGTMRWIYSNGRPYCKSSGQPDRLLGVSIDITERKRLEFERLISVERLASAVDIAALGFYEMGKDLCLNYMDERIRDIIGISPGSESTARQFWLDHIHPENISYVHNIIKSITEEGVGSFKLDYQYMHPERGLTWLNHLSRVLDRDADGNATRIIGVMQDITERKLSEEKLKKTEATLRNSQRDLQRLAGQLIAGKEEELCRLSRELHDDMSQRLAVLAIEAGKLELELTAAKRLPPEPSERIGHIKEQLIKVSEDVHRISRQLHPTILDDLGLVRAIESEFEAFKHREDLLVEFRRDRVSNQVPAVVSLCIYRIIQEGLNNITHHSGVKRCKVDLSWLQDTLYLTITDKGRGFDPEEVRHKPGLGLLSMRERVMFVQGDFSIESLLGRGTVIKVSIPLKESLT